MIQELRALGLTEDRGLGGVLAALHEGRDPGDVPMSGWLGDLFRASLSALRELVEGCEATEDRLLASAGIALCASAEYEQARTIRRMLCYRLLRLWEEWLRITEEAERQEILGILAEASDECPAA